MAGNKKRPRPDDRADSEVEAEIDEGAPRPASKRSKTQSNRTLFVRSLPPTATDESLTEFFSQHFPVKHATVVQDKNTKTSRGYGFVSFADSEDAVEAQSKLDKELWDGRRIRLELAEPRHRDGAGASVPVVSEERKQRLAAMEEARKPPKLIIRNLPWSIKHSDQLAKLFQSFGKVKYADLPSNKGKLSGFGFVTIRGRKNAEKAMETLNGQVVDGRTIAVDWAVDRTTWEQQRGQAEDDENADIAEDDHGDGLDGQKEAAAATEQNHVDQADADMESFMKNYMEGMEDEDDVEDDAEKEDDIDMEESSETSEKPSPVQERPAAKRTTDNSSTVFVRNLPYSITDAQLKTHFAAFGSVRYARVVMDKATARPAGTGFVCFFNEADSRACVVGGPRTRKQDRNSKNSVLQDDSADPEGKYTLDGRLLQVAKAVEKDQAARLSTSTEGRKERDKRRLFLLQEGAIDRRSPLYGLLSATDIKVREKSVAQRKKMVQNNPSLHLSLTRLAVRNIPRDMESKQLKELARQAVVEFAKDVKGGRRQALSKEEVARGGQEDKEGEHKRRLKRRGIVGQAKIVFETNEGSKVEESAGGKSRGYGFIEYSSHRWALMGLRWLNGHQLENEQGKKQRLIVEFAIENAQVVQRRRAPIGRRPRYAVDQDVGGSRLGDKRRQKSSKPPAVEVEEAKEAPDSRENLQHRLIARKRMVRKRKANARKAA